MYDTTYRIAQIKVYGPLSINSHLSVETIQWGFTVSKAASAFVTGGLMD